MFTPFCGEAAERLIERGRNVADTEQERRHHLAIFRLGVVGFTGKHHKARRVVGFVLDVGHQDIEAIDVGGETGGGGLRP